MKLYHWTNIKWLEAIMEEGAITLTASNLAGPARGEVSKSDYRRLMSKWTVDTEPKVVWLSNNPEVDVTYLGMIDVSGSVPRIVHALQLPAEWKKTRVRITVEVPDDDALWWPKWSRQMGIREAWYQHFAEGHRSPKEWFVTTRPIPVSEFVAIHIDNQQVWPKERAALATFTATLGKKLVGLLGR